MSLHIYPHRVLTCRSTHINLLYSLCHATTPPSIIDYREDREWQWVLRGELFVAFVSSPKWKELIWQSCFTSVYPPHPPSTIWGTIELYRPGVDLILNGEASKRLHFEMIYWHEMLSAALVIALMSKQFITHLLGPFLETFKETLYGRRTQPSGCGGVDSGGRLQEHARSRKAIFVSGPSIAVEVDILLDHHKRLTPLSVKPMQPLLLPHDSVTHHLLLSQPSPRLPLPTPVGNSPSPCN